MNKTGILPAGGMATRSRPGSSTASASPREAAHERDQPDCPGVTLAQRLVDGTKPGTGILWGVKASADRPRRLTGAGALVAFDASDVTKQLYSSDENTADISANATKFAPPTIANGRSSSHETRTSSSSPGLRNGQPPVQGRTGPGPTDPERQSTQGPGPKRGADLVGRLRDAHRPRHPGHCSGTGGCHAAAQGAASNCSTDKDTCYAGLV